MTLGIAFLGVCCLVPSLHPAETPPAIHDSRRPSDDTELRCWLHNGTEQPLTGLRVQNCVMLKAATGFAVQTFGNGVFIFG